MFKIYGTNPVRAALEANKLIKVLVSNDYKNKELLESLKLKKINIEFVAKNQLDSLVKENHQGIIGFQKDVHTVSLEEIISISKKKKNPIVLILDGISDPHNLGAILRSADAFDCSGIIFKKKGSVSLNETVAKVSTGAINFVKCSEVANLSMTIEKLKKEGFWVVGSEGFGISKLVKTKCDFILEIPMLGKVNCLNASVATSIALYALRN